LRIVLCISNMATVLCFASMGLFYEGGMLPLS